MLTYPNIDPVAISLGAIKVHWYGLTYMVALLGSLWLGFWRTKKYWNDWTTEQVSDFIFYGALGVILGGRLGYVLFYNLGYFVENPIDIFKLWQGGMSFHGGALGVFAAMYYFGKQTHKSFFEVSDFFAPFVPFGLMMGRIGNFIGAELYGRASDLPWAMVFPTDPAALPRHPSQLYQAALEGFTLFIILMWFSSKPRPRRAVSGLFLVGYGCFRFKAEFFREPDNHIGFDLLGWLTRGQLLCIPMIIFGALFLYQAYNDEKPNN